jgi:hypothetical protein
VPGPWFRIAFAQNAFTRLLAERGQRLDELTLAEGIRAMLDFSRDHRPQHAHLDELGVRWGPTGNRFEFAIVRRMQRDGQPESPLSLVFGFALTPGRQVHGSALIASVRDATPTEGYRAVARAAVLSRELD